MIKCKKSLAQEYECHVCVKPKWESEKEWICFDHCLANELFYLWDMGIITTGCCCGQHSNCPQDGSMAFIGVEDNFIPKMKELGYKVAYNPCRPNDEDSFIPKTTL